MKSEMCQRSPFGNNLRYLRELKGLSQRRLAYRIRSNRSSIGSYEENRAHPSFDTLVAISEYFQVTIDDLLKFDIKTLRKIDADS